MQPSLHERFTYSEFCSKVKMTVSERLILGELAIIYDSKEIDKTDKLYPSQKELALYSGLNEKTVSKALRELERKGLILTSKELGKKSTYHFTKKFFDLTKLTQEQIEEYKYHTGNKF